jgi:hypothetical protein
MKTAGNGEHGHALAPALLIYGAFALGMTTAIAFRVIIILQHVAPGWVRPVWYFAVVGNLAFFYYRYRIAEKRKRAVEEHGLIGKVEADTCFSPAEREALGYLLRSIKRSPENINYLIISAFSIIAIVVDLMLVMF